MDYEALKQAVKDSGYTQTAIAEKLGFAPSYICKIVNGKKDPKLSVLQAICDVVGVPIFSFFMKNDLDQELCSYVPTADSEDKRTCLNFFKSKKLIQEAIQK